jgi:hypothetical protein
MSPKLNLRFYLIFNESNLIVIPVDQLIHYNCAIRTSETLSKEWL